MKIKFAFTILMFGISVCTGIAQNEVKLISHYLFPEFTTGKVLMSTGAVKEFKLNYNSLTEEMIFQYNGTNLAIANPELVDTVYILDRKFIHAKKVFYELLENLPVPLFVHYTCIVTPPGKNSGYGGTSQTSAITSTSTVFSSRGMYDLKLPDDYTINPDSEYLLKKDDTYFRISNTNQVIKCFPEKEDAIKQFVKKNNISFKKEEDIRTLIKFCNK
jgi:hypothetical protein